MDNNILAARLDEISKEFQDQVRLIQSHYEGRAAEIKRMMEELEKEEKVGVDNGVEA